MPPADGPANKLLAEWITQNVLVRYRWRLPAIVVDLPSLTHSTRHVNQTATSWTSLRNPSGKNSVGVVPLRSSYSAPPSSFGYRENRSAADTDLRGDLSLRQMSGVQQDADFINKLGVKHAEPPPVS